MPALTPFQAAEQALVDAVSGHEHARSAHAADAALAAQIDVPVAGTEHRFQMPPSISRSSFDCRPPWARSKLTTGLLRCSSNSRLFLTSALQVGKLLLTADERTLEADFGQPPAPG